MFLKTAESSWKYATHRSNDTSDAYCLPHSTVIVLGSGTDSTDHLWKARWITLIAFGGLVAIFIVFYWLSSPRVSEPRHASRTLEVAEQGCVEATEVDHTVFEMVQRPHSTGSPVSIVLLDRSAYPPPPLQTETPLSNSLFLIALPIAIAQDTNTAEASETSSVISLSNLDAPVDPDLDQMLGLIDRIIEAQASEQDRMRFVTADASASEAPFLNGRYNNMLWDGEGVVNWYPGLELVRPSLHPVQASTRTVSPDIPKSLESAQLLPSSQSTYG